MSQRFWRPLTVSRVLEWRADLGIWTCTRSNVVDDVQGLLSNVPIDMNVLVHVAVRVGILVVA